MSLTARDRGSPRKAKKTALPLSARRANVPKTAVQSGIPISKQELQQAFEFFDVQKKGHLTIDDLKARLPIFYKNLPNRELRLLMNNKSELEFNDLYEMLADNMISNFDPVAEAFKIYDTKGTGFVNIDVLKTIFGQLGFGEITDEDIKIVIETADADGDGKIGLEDFRNLLTRDMNLGVFNTELSK